MSRLRAKSIVVFITLCIVLSFGIKVNAVDTSKIDVKVVVGFNDNYKVGYSTPVTLTIKDKYKDISGEVEIQVPSVPGKYMSYVKPLSMQKDSEKIITINVPVGVNRSKYKIVITNGKEKVYEDSFSIGMTANNMTSFIGILSEDFNSLSYINQVPAATGVTLLTKVIKLDEKNFPEDIFTLDAFDVLVINNFDTSKFSKVQYQILKQWVNNGGTLIIGTGQKHTKTLGIFKDDFIQGNVSEVKSIATSKIYSLGTNGDNKGDTAIDVLSIAVKDSTVLMEDKNVILVQSLSKGKGVVGILAFDLGQAPFANWNNNSAFAQKLLALITPNIMNMQAMNGKDSQNNSYMYREIFSKFSEMETAKTSSFYIILFIYILMVAPLNYFVLKKLDKREYMWITVPAIAIIFGIIVYASGSGTRLSKITTNMVSVLNIDKNGNAGSETYAGIFNSNKTKIKIAGKNGEKVLPISDQNYGQPNGQSSNNDVMEAKIFAAENGGVEYTNSSILETKVLQMQQNAMNIGKIEADISMENGNLVGTVKNTTSLDFYDCYIITPSNYYVMKDLKSGQSSKIGVSNGTTSGGVQQMIQNIFFNGNGNISNMSDSQRKEYMDKLQEGSMMQLEMTGNNMGSLGGVKLVAFSKTSIHSPLIINGIEAKKYERNIVYIPLDLKFRNADTIDYPLGLVPFNVNNTSTLKYDSSNNMFFGNGSAEISYSLDKDMAVEEIEINTTNNQQNKGTSIPDYFIFNVDKNTYDTLPKGVIQGDILKRYLSKDNKVKLKLELREFECSVPLMAAKGKVK